MLPTVGVPNNIWKSSSCVPVVATVAVKVVVDGATVARPVIENILIIDTLAIEAVLAAPTALQYTQASYPFYFSVKMQSDHNSGLVQVVGTAQLTIYGSTVTFTEAESSPPTIPGIILSGENLLTTSIPFCLAAQFGTGNSLNQAQLQQFVIEA